MATSRIWSGRSSGSSSTVSRSQALRNSTYWAGLRLRADLLSTMPVDVFKRVGGIQFPRGGHEALSDRRPVVERHLDSGVGVEAAPAVNR